MVAKAKNARFERRVLAIARQDHETKAFTRFYNLKSAILETGYAVGNGWMFRGNIFREIPRADSAAVKSEKEVIGNELEARGFWIYVTLLSDSSINPNRFAIDMRLTVYSTNDVNDGAPFLESVFATDQIFDPDLQSTYPTAYKFNMQNVNVLKTRRFNGVFQGNNGSYSKEVRMWVPIKGKKISREEESIVGLADTFGFLKGRNYYWLVEVIGFGVNPGEPNALPNILNGTIETKVYFKDA